MWNESMPKEGQIKKEILDVLPKEAFFTLQNWWSDGSGLQVKLRFKSGDKIATLNLPAWNSWEIIEREEDFIFLSAKLPANLQKAKEIIERSGCPLACASALEDQRFLQNQVTVLIHEKAEGYYFELTDNITLTFFEAETINTWLISELTKEKVIQALENFKAKK